MLLKNLALGFVGLCVVAITGVAHAGEKVMYQEITDNKPDVGVSTTVYLGDRMLEQGADLVGGRCAN